ncbi:interferon-stimulated 20 kDa exonuclease-like 2 [Denticeps clupeoides]|uniref:interferon-stimulated 20 kDa exonuclease-like 2 n=1 Tax=Denticeps clupeoides TaxID=299321 RepID=UPI0010A5571E|nr:interferon-stimulated 20 kDa exonuclease-like 2 [Denticeps clupeoides]
MSDLQLNLDLTCSDAADVRRNGLTGNGKHKSFLKKRKNLERRGFLNDKQNKIKHRPKPAQNNKVSSEKSKPSVKKVIPKHGKNIGDHSSTATSSQKQLASVTATAPSHSQKDLGCATPIGNPQKYLAIDCEMVGTGPKGRKNELARCSIVSYDGDVIYDKYIKPTNPVTDLRTRWSGIRWHHLHNASPFLQAKKEIVKILSGKVLVGHALHNDLTVLSYTHPASLTRDTSRIPLLNKKAGFPETQAASLKRLTKAIFGKDIQTGRAGHSSVEDAKASMDLYKVVEVEWEKELASKSQAN